tara:strand:+ start:59 stop:1288 length:1230 start_codon:yes stop_codon:yes gene_type:complete
MPNILSWEDLSEFKINDVDRVNGITNSYSNLRLFGHKEYNPKLILYRDRHAWCPYCQKIWLWLELKKVPYKIKKINMFCYGEKESWFLKKVRSGKLPAIELNGKIITESDNIIYYLEKEYGFLGTSINDVKFQETRKIERDIFRAWCGWLCREQSIFSPIDNRKMNLRKNLQKLENLLANSETGLIDPFYDSDGTIKPGTGDIIFIPYLERINASLCYYKGFELRIEFPFINKWFSLLEKEGEYLGTQGDFHTHSHDLPPQMGGCFKDVNEKQISLSKLIDNGEGLGNLEINNKTEDLYYSKFALMRLLKHKENIININPIDNETFDVSLRSALTYMMNNEINIPNNCSGKGLRYLRDRISVPRDMPLLSARKLRQALEKIASFDESLETYPIPTNHRYDQNPKDFSYS